MPESCKGACETPLLLYYFPLIVVMDFRHGVLYCGNCHDYVYDADFERIRLLELEKINALCNQFDSSIFILKINI
jgi:hypothetical protein